MRRVDFIVKVDLRTAKLTVESQRGNMDGFGSTDK